MPSGAFCIAMQGGSSGSGWFAGAGGVARVDAPGPAGHRRRCDSDGPGVWDDRRPAHGGRARDPRRRRLLVLLGRLPNGLPRRSRPLPDASRLRWTHALLITCLQPPAPATPSGPTRLPHGRSLRPGWVSAAVQHRHDLRRDHPGLELGLVQTAERDHDLRLDVGTSHAVVLDRPERRDREHAGTRRHQDEQTDQREDRPARHEVRKAPTCGGRNRPRHEALSGR
jgi:hypothetical protein